MRGRMRFERIMGDRSVALRVTIGGIAVLSVLSFACWAKAGLPVTARGAPAPSGGQLDGG
jgi:hypothetical protein